MAQQIIAESAAPSTPGTGYVAVYAKADGLVYSKDDAGTESILSGPSYSSGSFTITTVGLATEQSGTATYKIINGICNLTIPFLSNTSNSTSFSLSGLPAACQSSITPFFNVAGLTDNSAGFTSGIGQNSGSSILLWKDLSGAASWTAANVKNIYNVTVVYPLS